MDLNTITEVLRPTTADAVTKLEDGFAWLAGGTWLFSEPQINTNTLIDLETLKWPSLQASKDGLEIAATCKIVELDQFVEKTPSDWTAAPLFRKCCRCFLASFKICAGYVWTTLVGVPLTKIDASTNRIVAQWYGRGGDAIHFNYGTIWLADYDHHLVWRIKP